jgi:SAM-dependent methyltransferase
MLSSDRIDLFYQQRLKENGPGSKGVGWKDDFAQKIRFEQLIKVIQKNTAFTINDLGCGVGDLVFFLNEKEGYDFKYFGYDVLEEMITNAKKIQANTSYTSFFQISQLNDLQIADYTVASGIFNARHGISDEHWKSHILETIKFMNLKSKKGFAFNALTSYSDKHLMVDELFYADPLWLFDYCKRNFSRHVALLHDYGIYDFTILVRKED